MKVPKTLPFLIFYLLQYSEFIFLCLIKQNTEPAIFEEFLLSLRSNALRRNKNKRDCSNILPISLNSGSIKCKRYKYFLILLIVSVISIAMICYLSQQTTNITDSTSPSYKYENYWNQTDCDSLYFNLFPYNVTCRSEVRT